MLEVIWKLYPARRAMFMPYRVWLGPGFLILAIVMASASIGCFRRRIWSWWLAVVIFLINGLSEAGQILSAISSRVISEVYFGVAYALSPVIKRMPPPNLM